MARKPRDPAGPVRYVDPAVLEADHKAGKVEANHYHREKHRLAADLRRHHEHGARPMLSNPVGPDPNPPHPDVVRGPE